MNPPLICAGIVVWALIIAVGAAWISRSRKLGPWYDRTNTMRITDRDGLTHYYTGDRRPVHFDWSQISDIREEE